MTAETNPSENQQIRVLADCGNLCGEGPFWDDEDQILYWTDILAKRFFRYLWRDSRHERIHEGFQVAGFCLQEGGGFLVTNRTGIWLWSPGGAPVLLATEADGKPCVMNDCAADPVGRVYSGSCHYNPSGTCAPSFLFRVDTDSSVHVVDEGILFSNGIGFSPDLSTMYVADTLARCIYAYDYHCGDGSLKNRRIFVRVPREEGLPDGLKVDAEGFVWCAHWFGGCLTRYDPDGKRERKVVTPAAQTSSLEFGGPELNEIFITSAAASDVLSLAPPGYNPENAYVGGRLYQLTSNFRGQREYRSRIGQRTHNDQALSI